MELINDTWTKEKAEADRLQAMKDKNKTSTPKQDRASPKKSSLTLVKKEAGPEPDAPPDYYEIELPKMNIIENIA